MNKKYELPPLAANIKGGNIQWEQLKDIDFETLGFFLSCHLVIEHYLDEFLKTFSSELDWESVALTFNQKVSLVAKIKQTEPYIFIPALRHLNSLRNKLSHEITFRLTEEDMLPFIQFLRKITKNESELPHDSRAIMEQFTGATCAWFAGVIWQYHHSHSSRKLQSESSE